MNRKTYLVFVDLEKAFDNVDWKLLFQTMGSQDLSLIHI